MRPGVVLLGFALGSAVSITFGLVGVAVVFAVLGTDEPRLAGEFPYLLKSVALFALLTLLAAVSFYGELKGRAWRRAAIGGFAAVLALIAWVYWP